MISPVADGSAAAECIVRVRVWAYGGTKSSQRCAFEGGAGRGAEAAGKKFVTVSKPFRLTVYGDPSPDGADFHVGEIPDGA